MVLNYIKCKYFCVFVYADTKRFKLDGIIWKYQIQNAIWPAAVEMYVGQTRTWEKYLVKMNMENECFARRFVIHHFFTIARII